MKSSLFPVFQKINPTKVEINGPPYLRCSRKHRTIENPTKEQHSQSGTRTIFHLPGKATEIFALSKSWFELHSHPLNLLEKYLGISSSYKCDSRVLIPDAGIPATEMPTQNFGIAQRVFTRFASLLIREKKIKDLCETGIFWPYKLCRKMGLPVAKSFL